MINSIDMQKLHNDEHAQLIKGILEIIGNNDPAALQVVAEQTELKAVFDEIENLFKLSAGSPITPELKKLDDRRDHALLGLQLGISSLTHSADPLVKRHADRMSAYLDTYGSGIHKENYPTETSIIRHMIAGWNSDEALLAAKDALNLGSWIREMETANELFDKLYVTRAVESGSINAESIGVKRLEANSAWYKLRDILNAYYTIHKGADPYYKVIADVNGLIEFYIAILERRSSGVDKTTGTNGQSPAQDAGQQS